MLCTPDAEVVRCELIILASGFLKQKLVKLDYAFIITAIIVNVNTVQEFLN